MYTPMQILNMNDLIANRFLELLDLPIGSDLPNQHLRIMIELGRRNLIMDVYRREDIENMNPELVPAFLDNLPKMGYLLPESDPRKTVVTVLTHIGAIPNIGTTWLHTIPAEFRIQMIILDRLFEHSTLTVLQLLSHGYRYIELQNICRYLYHLTRDPNVCIPEPFRDRLKNLVKFLRRNHIFWGNQTDKDIYLKTGTYTQHKISPVSFRK